MADDAHCSTRIEQEMAEDSQHMRSLESGRGTVDVKSLLDEALFPLYRPLILNPVQKTDNNLQQFRPDPDVRSPTSFRGFIERVMTFKPQAWGADPNAALYFAKHGWRGTTECNIHCNVCLTSIECTYALKKGELWFMLAKKGHNSLCPFQFISTPDDLFKLPTDPEVIQKNVTQIWGSLLSLEADLPSITEEVISDLGIENKVVELFFEALESPVSEFGLSALVLGLCGWVKGNSRNTVECNFCQRCVGLHNFYSIADKTPQQEPAPGSSSEVNSREKHTPSPKPASSMCSEPSPSQEIIPSDCEVPLDSNDYVSEECSEASDVESGDNEEEEEEEVDEEESEDEQSSKMNVRLGPKYRVGSRKRETYEEYSEASDEEETFPSRFRSPVNMNTFALDSNDLLEREHIIKVAQKLKKKAIEICCKMTAKRMLEMENFQEYDSYSKGDVVVIDSDQDSNAREYKEPGTAESTDDENMDDEEDAGDMGWDRGSEHNVEVCNGSMQGEIPQADFNEVIECQSSSEAEDGSEDPLDTQGVKRVRDNVHDKDLNDSSSAKRRKVGDDPDVKEASSISQCTLVNVKDITNRLSEHGVTITKCVLPKIVPQTETNESRERGVKRKAESLDDDDNEEEDGASRTSQCPRVDFDVKPTSTVKAEELLSEASEVVVGKSNHCTEENSSAVTVNESSNTTSEENTISEKSVEIPMDMRNGIDSEKDCGKDSSLSLKEEGCKITNSNKSNVEQVHPAEPLVINGDIKEDPVECINSPNISNGDAAVISPGTVQEENSGLDRPNGKLDSESQSNSTPDVQNVISKEENEAKTCLTKTDVDPMQTKTDNVNKSSKSDHSSEENHVDATCNNAQESCETSVAVGVSESPAESGEKSADPTPKEVKVNHNVPDAIEVENAIENSEKVEDEVKDGECKGDLPTTNDNNIGSEEMLDSSAVVSTIETEIVVAGNSVTEDCATEGKLGSTSDDTKTNENVKTEGDSSNNGKENQEEVIEKEAGGRTESEDAVLRNEDESSDKKDDCHDTSLVASDSEQKEVHNIENGGQADAEGEQDQSTTAIDIKVTEDQAAMDIDAEDSKLGNEVEVESGVVEDSDVVQIDNADEMDVAIEDCHDSCEEKVTEEHSESGEKSTEESVSKKRRRSSVGDEEEGEQKDGHKRFKSSEPIAKLDFHPVKEHRFWCIYRLNTTSTSGNAKPGWAQLRDGLRLGLSMEYSCKKGLDIKDFRMRLAKHLAHW